MLSQMDTEVIKNESPQRMDYTRYYQPQINGISKLFHSINYSKKQLIIDYEAPQGFRQIVEEIKIADILVKQFRPGAMQNFNLSFDTVKKNHPNNVDISVTGYGQLGAKKDAAGHDLNYMDETGLLNMSRDEQGKPILPGFQLNDISGGVFMLLSACTSGLLAQRMRKVMQYIDVSLFDATVALGAIAQGMLQRNADYNKMPILSGYLVNCYVNECSDKKWIALGTLELKFWNSFCDMVQQPSWKTLDLSTLAAETFNKTEVEELFKTKTQEQGVVMASNFDVCLSPVLEVKEVYEQKHTKDRAVFKEIKIDEERIHVYAKPYKTIWATARMT